MATREDQAESVVLHGPGLLSWTIVGFNGHLGQEFATSRLAAKVIDRPIARGRRDPATCIGWQSVRRPLPKGEGEGFLDGILGQVDVAEDPDEGRDGPTGLFAEDPADQRVINDRQRSAASGVHERPDLDRR